MIVTVQVTNTFPVTMVSPFFRRVMLFIVSTLYWRVHPWGVRLGSGYASLDIYRVQEFLAEFRGVLDCQF